MRDTQVYILLLLISIIVFVAFQHAMDIMGLSKEDQHNIFSLLAGILHLGNVQFGDKNNYATVLSERG